jgi:hypothetical protein
MDGGDGWRDGGGLREGWKRVREGWRKIEEEEGEGGWNGRLLGMTAQERKLRTIGRVVRGKMGREGTGGRTEA